MKTISLSRGEVAIVDDEDFDWLSQWKWSSAHKRAVRCAQIGDRRSVIQMSRVILNAPQGIEVDHVNGDTLDNRRSNLRLATSSQNKMNRAVQKNSKSGVKGVWWNKQIGKWQAQIVADGNRYHLGVYTSIEDAGIAYGEAAEILHGEFRRK